MVKKVIYSKKAFTDIDRIIEFNNLRNRSTTYSEKFIVRLNKRLHQLIKQPLSGMNAGNSGRLVLIWDDYYIFYRIEKDFINIHIPPKENVSR